jgi:iron complex outermembrane receptor protein
MIWKNNFHFNNTYFGEVTWQHATDIKRPNFAGKVITDLGIAYKFTSTLSANVMVNNYLMYIQIYWIQKGMLWLI